MDDAFKHLALVTGATGPLGQALIKNLQARDNVLCVGISRDHGAVLAFNTAADKPRNVIMHLADITKTETMMPLMRGVLGLPGIREITLLHALGPFKYEGYKTAEEAALRGIDPATIYMHSLCLEDMTQIMTGALWERGTEDNPARLKVCTFGSISEPYKVPLWHSFNVAKQRAHDFVRDHTAHGKSFPGLEISSLYARTGSINPLNGDAEELARCTLSQLDALPPGMHLSLDIMKPLAGFDAASYYGDTEKLHENWCARLAGGEPS